MAMKFWIAGDVSGYATLNPVEKAYFAIKLINDFRDSANQ